MDVRTKSFYSVFLFAAVIADAGCAYNQQSRFQMSFLPRAVGSGEHEIATIPPPAVSVNPYLQNKVPSALRAEPLPPRRKSRGDTLVQNADQAFQRGKRAYQANDVETARKEFDAAIDLMLEASDENPADRAEY